MWAIVSDITQQKLKEKTLRESEERYRMLFDNMLEGFSHCKMIFEDGRPQDFVYLHVNDAFERLTGLKNVVGRKVTEVIPGIKESNPELLEIYGKVALTGNPEKFETYVDPLGIWFSVSVYSTKREYFVAVFDNITERKRAEEALRTSEAQLSNAVKMARLGHWEYDVAKDLFTFNDHFYQLFRTTAEQVGGYTMPSADYARRFVHPDDMAVVGEETRKAIETKDPHFSRQLEHRILYADGEIGYITVQFFVTKDDLGRTVKTYGVNQDVTERKRVEESLRKSEERLDLALQGGDLGLWDLHIPTGQAVANQRAAEIAGYSLDEIEQNFGFWERLLHPDDRQRALEKVFNHLAGLTDHYEDEYRVRHKSGHWRWIFSRGKVTERDQDGKPLRMTGTYLDITDRKTSELQVAEANELRERIVSDSPMGIAVYKSDGQCISANEALGRILGADRERLLTQNFRNLTSWKVSGLLADAELVLSGGINNQRELNFTSTFGKIVWVNARMARLASGDEPQLLVVINDITERKKAEEEQDHLKAQLLQAQKMEATGTLAGGIAHDFNNLLTVVMGFSELLLAEKDQKHPEYADLQKIFHAAKNGAELVQRLLMFSRKSEPKPIPMDLNKQIVQIEKLLRRTIPRMVDILLELSADLPRINADPSQVEQVLMNLAVNARDAMPDKGKLTVRTDIVTLDEEYCRLHIEANPGEYVLLEVSDTGHGMDKQTVEHIFEPFFTTKEMGRGTGLGLAMVYGIVKQHKGHITVHSEVGRGTTFQVYLPAIPGEAETGVETPEEVPAYGTETVLLVDDEEFVRELGARILTKCGYTVIQAVNGREALDLFKKERSKISLVILDLIMPEMGGSECLKELLKIDPQVNVLVASGYSADASVKETIQMGAKSFVTKPFRVKELLHDVRRVLDRS